MKRFYQCALVISLLSSTRIAQAAAPTITAVQGLFSDQQSVAISGINFGGKYPAAPYIWADFESGVDPSPLGVKTSWDKVENLEWSNEGMAGTKGLKSSNGTSNWSVRVVNPKWAQPNQAFYVFKRERTNFLVTNNSQNFKEFQIMPSVASSPNLYMSRSNGRVFVEGMNSESGFWGNFRTKKTDWVTNQVIGRMSSIGSKDGTLALYQDGKLQGQGSILTRSNQSQTAMDTIYAAMGSAVNKGTWSPAWSSDNHLWIDDLYVDTTWARVLVGDAPTLAACTDVEIQIPSAWSDNSITVHVNNKVFAPGANLYVYVFNSNGEVNNVGFPINAGAPTLTVDAGADQSTLLASAVTLFGTVSKNSVIETVPTASLQWQQINGPGRVSFTSPSSASTQATFNSTGTYVLRLLATEDGLTAGDTVQVSVRVPLLQVNAGADQSATLGTPLTLTGNVLLDGAIQKEVSASVKWDLMSGPGSAVINNANAQTTQISFSSAGVYEVSFTATQYGQTTSDTLLVTASAIQNKAPVISMGAPQAITAGDICHLSAKVTDDGVPTSQSLTTTWSMVDGPRPCVLTSPTALTSDAKLSAPGHYVFRLTASDSIMQSYADTTVDVSSADGKTPNSTVSVNGVSGQWLDGQSIRIDGAGFGEKEPAAPYIWADFENGVEPSPLSVKKSWGQVQGFQWSPNGFNGTKCVESSDSSGVWTLRADYNYWSQESQHMYLFRRQKSNFVISDISQNWKIWRMWPLGNGYPNIYASCSNGRVFVENIGSDSGFWSKFMVTTRDWYNEEIIFKASSALNKKDGQLTIRQGGVQRSNGTLITRSSAAPAYMAWNYVVHGVGANFNLWSPSWKNGNKMWADDIYVDTTWARVMLGDADTYAACREFEPQIPTAWSDQSITVQARLGVFKNSSVAYLYVFDKDGNVNAKGYPVARMSGDMWMAVGALSTGNSHSAVAAPQARNVFNPAIGESARLVYELEASPLVTGVVYDRQGDKVRSIAERESAGSFHQLEWDGRNDDGQVVASGIYIAVIKAGGETHKQKLVVLK